MQDYKALLDSIIEIENNTENRAVWTLFRVYTFDNRRGATTAACIS